MVQCACAVIAKSIDLFFGLPRSFPASLVFRRRDDHRLPASFLLLAKNVLTPKGIAAVQRQAVVKDVEDFHVIFNRRDAEDAETQ